MAQSMIWLIFLLFVPSLLINAQYGVQLYNQSCLPTARIYAPQSTFHQNLKIVLENLNDVASTTNYNFHFSSYGQDENKVCALYLCRGDLSPLNCSLCIRNVSVDIVNNCNRTESIRWIEKCMIRYANRNIFFKEEESPSHSDTAVYYGPPSYTPPPAPTPTHTPYTLTQTIDILINETAFSKRAFAKREDNITESLYPIYSLAQCTPDISQKLCHKCLERAFQNLKNSGPLSGESLSYLPSCQLRFDDHNFFEDNSETDPPFSTDQQTPSHKKQKGQRIRTVLIATAAVTALVFIGAGICFTMQAWKPKKLSSAADDEVITVESLQLDFNSIRAATDDFSEDKKLGQGGFGAVYKGNLQDGQAIAVKRLSPNSRQGIQEFKTEVLLVAKLQHKNLVRLLGFCVTGEEKLLVYEFLLNSSLDRYLNGYSNSQQTISLDWKTRYKIIDGIAKGLLYLHEDSRFKIVHRDLKPSNILLDKDMVPKISDFGMAKLFGEDEIQGISNRIVGTQGYMAPEYIRTGHISFKSDVYSFGVLVLEIVSGQRIKNSFIHTPHYEEGLIHYAWRLWNANEALELVDAALCGSFSADEAKRCIHAALSCIQEDAEQRPSMASIVSVLNTHSSSLPQLPERGISAQGGEQYISTYSGTEDITALSGR